MSEIYLTGIELEHFRSFATLSVELAPEPNVLIVHGSNGLGKSSLFDAVEWTLTDNIDHFRPANGYDKVGKYLCRWRDEPGSTRASLRFSDGTVIERRLASAHATASILEGSVKSLDDIAQFLKASTWNQTISGLDRYLLLTHFLGQSASSRLTHKSDEDRFAILKEAAQSAELEGFGIALHGKGSNAAARAFGKRISQLERDLADLAHLLAQEEQLWQGAQASGGLDEAAAQDITRQLASVLARVTPGATITGPRGDGDEQSGLDAAVDLVRLRRLALTQSRLNQNELQRNEVSAAEHRAALEDVQRELTERTAEAAQRSAEASEKRTSAVEMLAAVGAAQGRSRQLAELGVISKRIASVEDEHARVTSALNDEERVLASAEMAVIKVERRRQITRRLQTELGGIEGDLDGCARDIDRIDEWLPRSAQIAVLRSSLSALNHSYPAIDETVRSAESAFAEASRNAEAQARLLQQMQETVLTMTSAVATVAASLAEDSCDCPVCETHFDNAAELKERAVRASERLAPLLTAQHDAYNTARELAEAAALRLETVNSAQSQIQSLTAEVNNAVVVNDRLFDQIGWSGTADYVTLSNYRDVIDFRASALRRRHRRKQHWIAVLASENAAVAEASALRLRDEALRRRQSLSRDAMALSSSLQELTGEMVARQILLLPGEDIRQDPERLTNAVALAAEEVRRATDASAAAEVAAGEAETRAAFQQTSLVRLTARASELAQLAAQAGAALGRNRQRWLTLGWYEDGPLPGELERAEQQLAISESALDQATSLVKRLHEGRETWARQQAHAASFERLRSVTDLAPNSERTQIREKAQKNLAMIEHQLEATRQAKEIAGKTSAAIAIDVADFNAEYIQPLDGLMKKINRAILCDPRVGIDLHVKRNTIAQSAAREGELPSSVGQIDPLLVHSEGQMAALAVSMLCAASLTYPWARWKALILDDPLQHNDAIHASAFADFIGNLVEQRQYQVLLSTHDLAQAEFLQRKFDARKVPCNTLSLLGRGKEGVKWEFPVRAGGKQQLA